MNDAPLLAALRASEPDAFERLVREQGGRLLAVCERLLFNREDARDAVQDAFLSAFRSLDSFDGRSQLSTWLHRIAINAALMKLRSKKRHPERSIEDLLPVFQADGHQTQPSGRWMDLANDMSENNELRQLIRSKIESLPES